MSPPTTQISTLSLHDALPISVGPNHIVETVNLRYAVYNKSGALLVGPKALSALWSPLGDRKSTRLNSSHRCISYAVFCLKKKKKKKIVNRLHHHTVQSYQS